MTTKERTHKGVTLLENDCSVCEHCADSIFKSIDRIIEIERQDEKRETAKMIFGKIEDMLMNTKYPWYKMASTWEFMEQYGQIKCPFLKRETYMKCSNCKKGRPSYWVEGHGFCNVNCYKKWLIEG